MRHCFVIVLFGLILFSCKNEVLDPGREDDSLVEMVKVDGDTFTMGYVWNVFMDDADLRGRPIHKVILNSFYISKYEITQSQYALIMADNPSSFSGDNLPVEQVAWYDAVLFCNELSKKEGLDTCFVIEKPIYSSSPPIVHCDFSAKGYRLPTEAEWEFAARGGDLSRGFMYSGSDIFENVAWYFYNSDGRSHDVGTKRPNELGIYDMSGNVAEWCWDYYGDYSAEAQTNPTGPDTGNSRVFRGGSWRHTSGDLKVSSRGSYQQRDKYNFLGFRICRTR